MCTKLYRLINWTTFKPRSWMKWRGGPQICCGVWMCEVTIPEGNCGGCGVERAECGEGKILLGCLGTCQNLRESLLGPGFPSLKGLPSPRQPITAPGFLLFSFPKYLSLRLTNAGGRVVREWAACLTYDSSLQVVFTWDWCGLIRCTHDTWQILWREKKAKIK
jgi:hypothetical protein